MIGPGMERGGEGGGVQSGGGGGREGKKSPTNGGVYCEEYYGITNMKYWKLQGPHNPTDENRRHLHLFSKE